MPNGEGPVEPALPVVDSDDAHPAHDRQESEGTALCLSGGGYRAMVFHLGAIIRLNELGKLRGLDRVSSVSGGSITAGVLGRAWDDLKWSDESVVTNLGAETSRTGATSSQTQRFARGCTGTRSSPTSCRRESSMLQKL